MPVSASATAPVAGYTTVSVDGMDPAADNMASGSVMAAVAGPAGQPAGMSSCEATPDTSDTAAIAPFLPTLVSAGAALSAGALALRRRS